mmetsp:Transcript_19521/g.21171  ORF Transcript_19521/g.21171 Transcript_19521/m.21171 type:complete len:541 (+) Transcript_19521:72-1694(+)
MKSNVSPQQNANTSVGMPASNCTNSIFPNSEDCISNFWAKFHREQKQHEHFDSVRLSFISHALAIQLLDSKPVTEMCSPDNVQHLFSEVELTKGEITISDEKIEIVNFTHNEDALRSLACVSVTRFINSNYQNVLEYFLRASEPSEKTYYSDTFYGDGDLTFIVKSSHTLCSNHTRGQLVLSMWPNKIINYKEISHFLNQLDNTLEIEILKTANLIRLILKNDFTYIKFILRTNILTQNDIHQLVNLTYLLFVCETSRNPAAFIHHQMLLDLKIGNHITWTIFFDLMPMSPKDSIQRARSLNQLYQDYLPSAYEYDKYESNEVPKLLIQTEATVVKIWLNKVKGIHRSVFPYPKNKDVVNLIKASIKDWYGIDLKNNIEEDEYTEDQIISFLESEKPSDYTVLTPREIKKWEYDILEMTPVIIPIRLDYNCWAGVLVRKQQDTKQQGTKQQDPKVQLIYINPSNVPNHLDILENLRSACNPNIVQLNARDLLHNPNVDGLFLMQNLKSLAKLGKNLDNRNAEEIIKLMNKQEIKKLMGSF